ncbi:murein biosynthesis integral membrane protein MurJ [Candidatus Roizmanbacteria bacterium RIFCSPHIGHO2_02_FULL_40_9]|uniref:Lipid II flippase n=2 Tax=Candidatus Roizmaniibacteriota TaxID=1752723 RepID=A0A1F7IK00_9BACT|nr:MAG: murein biosynthesis integral membrane protein MurJ [Candidatus Roizmanbacteria bacterium RIFCSPHIGHO2_02_FULL_40_9]OGK43681.1 MAG: murein biosynthesis integral membrane protein MurJ [Candidatus Roizmanbacteria bacterium RIFCSPLOWO2_01_FULL_38_11]
MENFFNNTKKLIFQRQKDILSSAIILSAMIIISRLFGFVRYRTFATYFTKEELDIFFAAFRIPDFVFEILITGALSSAFIPIFIKYKRNEETVEENISSIMNFIFIGMIIIMSVAFIAAEPISRIIAPGFSPEDIKQVAMLSRILILSQLPFLIAGNLLSGVAQANKIFFITAIAPVVYNVGIILGTIFFSHQYWLYGPAIGVTIGAFLFFLVQLPVMYIVHFSYKLRSFKRNILKEFITLFIPRMLSVLTNQIDLTIDLILATLRGPGSYTIFYFSQHLQLFPVSFVGMAFGQAALPYVSNLFKEEKFHAVRKLFVDSILQLLYLSIPLSIFFIFARTPIVRIVFGGRKFDWIGTNLTAMTVSIFALSVPIHSIFYFITRSFYACHDTKTPFIINFFSVAVNAVLSIIFIVFMELPVWSLALSFSISIVINVALLLRAFHKKIGGFDVFKLIKNSIKIYIAAFLASIGPYVMLKVFDPLVIDTARTINVFILMGIIFGAYCISYLFFSWLFTIEEIYILGRLFSQINEFKRRIEEVYTESG